MKISTIAIAEFCVKAEITDLPLRNLQILPFNYNHDWSSLVKFSVSEITAVMAVVSVVAAFPLYLPEMRDAR